MVRAFVHVLNEESELPLFIAPINEISFFAWAGGESAYLNPFETDRPHELKAQLVRAAIEGIEAAWSVNPRTRIVHTDPLINVVHNLARPEEFEVAEYYRLLMFQAWDMLAGRRRPDLGGDEKYLDIIGVNYYPNNQWLCGETSFHPERWLDVSDPQYRPLSSLLSEKFMNVTTAQCSLPRQELSPTHGRIGCDMSGVKSVKRLSWEYLSRAYAYIRLLTSPAGEMTVTARPVFGVWLMRKATGRYISH